MEYPDEHLVRLIQRLFSHNNNLKILDLGCGSGNNLQHLAKLGFDTYGCDISAKALHITEERLKKFNLKTKLIKFDHKIPYKNNYFDAVICWYTLYYNDMITIKNMINEIYRVLKPNGKILITLIRKNDMALKKAIKQSEHTYIINSNIPSQKGAIIYVVNNKKEIIKLFNNFKLNDIGYFYWQLADRTSSHLFFWGEKK